MLMLNQTLNYHPPIFLDMDFSTGNSKVVFVLTKPFLGTQICRNREKKQQQEGQRKEEILVLNTGPKSKHNKHE